MKDHIDVEKLKKQLEFALKVLKFVTKITPTPLDDKAITWLETYAMNEEVLAIIVEVLNLFETPPKV